MFHDSQKRLRYVDSFLRKRLIHLNLQLLYTCNFRCHICDFWKEPYRSLPQLSVPQIQVIAEKLKQLGPQVISLGGGEPLMHKELLNIVRILSHNNFLAMICNGWFVTPENARALFQAGMYEVSISVDYAMPQKHDEQRGVEGAFERAVNGLKTLHENRVSPHQRVQMISVVMDDNLADIEPLILQARKIGVTYLVTLYSDGRGKKETKASCQDVSEHLLKLKRKYRDFVALPRYLEQFSEAVANNGIVPCYAGKNLFNIDSQGNVTLCIDRLDDPVGNILTDDIHDLEQKLLDQHRKNHCRGCWTSCRGSLEPMMYGKNKLRDFWHFYQMTKDVPLVH